MINTSSLPDFFNALKKRTSGDVRNDRFSIVLYSTDASNYSVPPIGVFIPRTSDDVQAAVEVAAEFKIPVLPRGAGTSLAGQTVNEALVIDMTHHLDRIVEINPEEKTARVQPGVVVDELNAALKTSGLKFGPDPASANRATMGGSVSNNATGSHSILYGMSADHVLAMHVVLSDGSKAEFSPLNHDQIAFKKNLSTREGTIYRGISKIVDEKAEVIRENTPRHWRRAGGYNLDRFVDGPNFYKPRATDFNLANLLCGAEGSLAVMTELTCGLVSIPPKAALAILHFQTHRSALLATEVVLQTQPDAVELFDSWCLQLTKNAPQYAKLLRTFALESSKCLLIVEVSGASDSELRAKLDNLKKHIRSNKIECEFTEAIDAQQQQNVWAVRKAGLGLLASRRGEKKPVAFIEDAAVPVPELPDYVQAIETFCEQGGVEVAYYAHASAGCLHIRPFLNLKSEQDITFMKELAVFSAQQVQKSGGILASEHGDGRSRSWLNKSFFGDELYQLFCDAKAAFDPDNLMNPGSVVGAADMDRHLRYGTAYKTSEIATFYNFEDENGFAAAVEMCNGAAVCKKKNTGGMCPSYMVTKDEKHSTRGRANALRAALSGHFPHDLLFSKEMADILDLCVECKACKSECPSSVDMARLKFEFLAQYNKRYGVSLRSRLFGEFGLLSRLSSGFPARIVNPLLDMKFLRILMEQFIGITAKRKLAPFAYQSFSDYFHKRTILSKPDAAKVVLFNDTFNNYSQPEVLIAALEVLEAAGFQVLLSEHGDCGRAMISKGLFDRAKKMAQTTVDRLIGFAEQGLPIVGVEPSCLLTLQDEYRTILPGDKRVDVIAENSFLLEEFVVRFADTAILQTKLRPSEEHVLLHGHCHQKALAGTDATHQFLNLIPGVKCEEIDSACCGMAGSFGYEKEHYDISIAMGERRLFPSIRKAKETTFIAVPGFSCRQQVKHGTAKVALHPAQILAAHLK
ncbi:MAG: FAD-binding protein [Deferribacteres bacterium]|nr:FAD-binding protein [candidate division KSB1 bacterium]MCB9502352.1 FAD-binding protein [Deferribacteres bacterium]